MATERSNDMDPGLVENRGEENAVANHYFFSTIPFITAGDTPAQPVKCCINQRSVSAGASSGT